MRRDRRRRLPRAGIPEYLAQVAVLAQDHGAFISGCGHIGDGNVHITVFQPDEERRHGLMDASFELASGSGVPSRASTA